MPRPSGLVATIQQKIREHLANHAFVGVVASIDTTAQRVYLTRPGQTQSDPNGYSASLPVNSTNYPLGASISVVEMGGSWVAHGALGQQNFQAQALSGQSVSATGTVTANAATVATAVTAGSVAATGTVSANAASVTNAVNAGSVSAGSVSATGTVAGNALSATGAVTGASASITNALTSGTHAIGGGTTITKLAIVSASLTTASVPANATSEQTFTVAGVTASDKIMFVNKQNTYNGVAIANVRVAGTNSIAITFANVGSGSAIGVTDTFIFGLIRS